MTFYEETNPKDISVSQILPTIRDFLPEVTKNDFRFIYHGTYNVFEVKNRYILRIPDKSLRNERGVSLLIREENILNFLKANLSLPIPKPIYMNLGSNLPFMIYEKLSGLSLSRCITRIDNNCLMKIAHGIGNFLSHLHSVKLAEEYSKVLDIQITDFNLIYQKIWEKEFQEVQEYVMVYINRDQREWIESLYIDYLSKIRDYSIDPVLIHGDFDTSNILVYSDLCELSGIIDFEDSRLFDPAADFLFYREGSLFLKQILHTYKGRIDETFQERMRFLFSRNSLPYIIYGAKIDNSSLIEAGKELLSDRIARFP
jgi:aminoglycoside phosphotransferase (APT) family kinase protein